MFSYSGIRRVAIIGAGVSTCAVILVSAIMSGGSQHVAVWMGASTHNGQSWLQAGVEKSSGQQVAEYIEVGKRGKQISLHEWPTTFGHKARIRLLHHGSLWRIHIDGHSSKWTWLPGAKLNRLALLETYTDRGIAHGVAVIDGSKVKG